MSTFVWFISTRFDDRFRDLHNSICRIIVKVYKLQIYTPSIMAFNLLIVVLCHGWVTDVTCHNNYVIIMHKCRRWHKYNGVVSFSVRGKCHQQEDILALILELIMALRVNCSPWGPFGLCEVDKRVPRTWDVYVLKCFIYSLEGDYSSIFYFNYIVTEPHL